MGIAVCETVLESPSSRNLSSSVMGKNCLETSFSLPYQVIHGALAIPISFGIPRSTAVPEGLLPRKVLLNQVYTVATQKF